MGLEFDLQHHVDFVFEGTPTQVSTRTSFECHLQPNTLKRGRCPESQDFDPIALGFPFCVSMPGLSSLPARLRRLISLSVFLGHASIHLWGGAPADSFPALASPGQPSPRRFEPGSGSGRTAPGHRTTLGQQGPAWTGRTAWDSKDRLIPRRCERQRHPHMT